MQIQKRFCENNKTTNLYYLFKFQLFVLLNSLIFFELSKVNKGLIETRQSVVIAVFLRDEIY